MGGNSKKKQISQSDRAVAIDSKQLRAQTIIRQQSLNKLKDAEVAAHEWKEKAGEKGEQVIDLELREEEERRKKAGIRKKGEFQPL